MTRINTSHYYNVHILKFYPQDEEEEDDEAEDDEEDEAPRDEL